MTHVGTPVSLRVGLLLAGMVLLGAGCDWLGIGPADAPTPSFTVTDDLAARTSVLPSTSSSEAASGAAVSLTPVLQVRPPTVAATRTQASNLSYDPETRWLQVGYKLAGADFGGGIDVLRVRTGEVDGGLVIGRRSLRSANVDVVAVQSAPADEALYAAGAVTTNKRRRSPAVVTRIGTGNTDVDARSTRLSHNVAKSLVVGPSPNTVHVITDENTLFQLDAALKNKTKRTVRAASGFRSVVAQGTDLFVLDQSGRVFRAEGGASGALSEVVRLTDMPFGNGTVARLHAGENWLYAALNEQGFAVFSPAGDSVWTHGPVSAGARYTSIATGPEHVYVGRFDGQIEVYRRPASLSGGGPERVGTFGPWTDGYGGRLSAAPMNQLRVIDGHLYAARSRDGLVVFRIDEE